MKTAASRTKNVTLLELGTRWKGHYYLTLITSVRCLLCPAMSSAFKRRATTRCTFFFVSLCSSCLPLSLFLSCSTIAAAFHIFVFLILEKLKNHISFCVCN